MCYLYAVHVTPWADSEAKLYTSQFILGLYTQQLSLLQLIVRAHYDTFSVFTQWMLWSVSYVDFVRQCMCCFRTPKVFSWQEDSVEGHFVVCPPDNVWNWFFSKCFCVVLIWSSTLHEHGKNICQMVQGSLQLPTCGTASHISMLHMQVWWTVSEEDVYPYLKQRVEHLEPRAIAQCTDFYHFPFVV